MPGLLIPPRSPVLPARALRELARETLEEPLASGAILVPPARPLEKATLVAILREISPFYVEEQTIRDLARARKQPPGDIELAPKQRLDILKMCLEK
jgi:hypothetical protein